MQTYELLVQNRAMLPNSADMTLVRTSVGIDRIHVLFDNMEWADFPITVTFANGDAKVSTSLSMSAVDSAAWALEGECVIPWEVVRKNGPIRVTFQGTDAAGNHIVTAYGAPLSVEEAGDVEMGEVPEEAPTVDQWNQAYADAAAATNQLASKLAEVDEALAELAAWEPPLATTESPGTVKPDGETITVDADGTITAAPAYELPPATETSLGGVMADGVTVTVDENGTISAMRADTSGIEESIADIRALLALVLDVEEDQGGNVTSAIVKASALPYELGDGEGY